VGHNENGVNIKRMFDQRACVLVCLTEQKLTKFTLGVSLTVVTRELTTLRPAWNVHLVQNACFLNHSVCSKLVSFP
jgi:hypothetical protein